MRGFIGWHYGEQIDADFDVALAEARSSAQGTSGRIIGFLGEPSTG